MPLAHLAFWPANAGLVCCYTHVCAHVCVYACAYVAHMHAQSLKVHVQPQAPTQPPAQPSNGHHHSLATTMTAAAVVSAACNLHQVLSVCQNALLFRCSHQSYRPHLPYHSIRASRVMAASRAPQRDTTGSHCDAAASQCNTTASQCNTTARPGVRMIMHTCTHHCMRQVAPTTHVQHTAARSSSCKRWLSHRLGWRPHAHNELFAFAPVEALLQCNPLCNALRAHAGQ